MKPSISDYNSFTRHNSRVGYLLRSFNDITTKEIKFCNFITYRLVSNSINKMIIYPFKHLYVWRSMYIQPYKYVKEKMCKKYPSRNCNQKFQDIHVTMYVLYIRYKFVV